LSWRSFVCFFWPSMPRSFQFSSRAILPFSYKLQI
jgi:hypothetical protein